MGESDRITGSYPGGPHRPDQDPRDGGRDRPRLDGAETIEERAQERRRSDVRRRRRQRLLVGFLVAVVVAGGVGFWIGRQADRTSQEIAAEENRGGTSELDLTRERNIILQQLWLMEDLERARSP